MYTAGDGLSDITMLLPEHEADALGELPTSDISTRNTRLSMLFPPKGVQSYQACGVTWALGILPTTTHLDKWDKNDNDKMFSMLQHNRIKWLLDYENAPQGNGLGLLSILSTITRSLQEPEACKTSPLSEALPDRASPTTIHSSQGQKITKQHRYDYTENSLL